MFTLSEPSDREIAKYVSSQAKLPFSYAEAGATRSNLPSGYTLDHNRIQLGRGMEIYQRAVEALKQWRQFELGWVTLVPHGVKVETGAVVAVKARTGGVWSLNACRVVYVIDEAERFGFAYGTLPDHIERGEERFLIERQPNDDSVWYDILAFSRPRHALVKAGFPYARMLQKRFARDSMAVMKSVVKSA
ncbi:MAG: DUF1990 domain-containing protein [Acidobacteria bacterium]|nr:DUF1990 domain-containing protein [Acidobacteriota bacterium]MCA1627443.1 DUF1990 domain-containing protein [Acidobacteriota bacterium]